MQLKKNRSSLSICVGLIFRFLNFCCIEFNVDLAHLAHPKHKETGGIDEGKRSKGWANKCMYNENAVNMTRDISPDISCI